MATTFYLILLGGVGHKVRLPVGFSLREQMLFPMYMQGHIQEF